MNGRHGRTAMGRIKAVMVGAVVIIAVLGAAILVSRPSESATALPTSSATSSTSSASSTAALLSSVYQVIESNLTLRGQTATIPCAFLVDWLLLTCPPADNTSLSHVDLLRYGSAYYYSLQNQTGPTGFGSGINRVNYTYDMWFTNSTVFCVSYALPKGYACPTLPHDEETTTIPARSNSSLDPSNRLRLNLTLSTNSAGVLNVTIGEFNTLDHVNNATEASGFPPATNKTDFYEWNGGICSDSPIGYEVIQGNYGEDNFTQGTALALAIQSPVQCVELEGSSNNYIFKPLSDVANLSRASSGFWMGSLEAYSGNSCSNDLDPSPSCHLSFIPFPPGTYSVVAGDVWGQIVVLHFTIQS
jgi:hypothetical protein